MVCMKINETPGCLAWRLGQKEVYKLVVKARVRAGLLLNLMDGYKPLADGDEEDVVTRTRNTAQRTPTKRRAQPPIDGPADVNSKSYLSCSRPAPSSTLPPMA